MVPLLFNYVLYWFQCHPSSSNCHSDYCYFLVHSISWLAVCVASIRSDSLHLGLDPLVRAFKSTLNVLMRLVKVFLYHANVFFFLATWLLKYIKFIIYLLLVLPYLMLILPHSLKLVVHLILILSYIFKLVGHFSEL